MRRWNKRERTKARIEIIPMIDVMMFLLVFFVLISINVLPALGLKTKLPQSSQVEELIASTRVVITIGNNGEIFVDAAPVTLEQLPQNLRKKQSLNKKLAIVINGDGSAPLQRLFDVIDVIKGSGFEALSIAARKKQGAE